MCHLLPNRLYSQEKNQKSLQVQAFCEEKGLTP